jgi:hypothetical protein
VPNENNVWQFDIASDSTGGGDVKEGITVCAVDELEIEGSRGTANFVMKWKGSNQHAYIKIVPMHRQTGEYPIEKSGEFVKVAAFECRGLSLERWLPGDDFFAEAPGGNIFPEVDLTDPDGWTEYDEKAGEPVSIMNLEHRIVRM